MARWLTTGTVLQEESKTKNNQLYVARIFKRVLVCSVDGMEKWWNTKTPVSLAKNRIQSLAATTQVSHCGPDELWKLLPQWEKCK
jgi:hypothetical protein